MTTRLSTLVYWLLARSDEFTAKAIDKGVIECLLRVLDDTNFINQYEAYCSGNLDIFIASIGCLAYNPEQDKNRWHNADAIRILNNVSNDHPKLSLGLYRYIVAIAKDQDLEKLAENSDMIDKIVSMIVEGLNNQNKLKFTKFTYEIFDEVDQTQHKVNKNQFFLKSVFFSFIILLIL